MRFIVDASVVLGIGSAIGSEPRVCPKHISAGGPVHLEALPEAHRLRREEHVARVAIPAGHHEDAAAPLRDPEASKAYDSVRPAVPESFQLGDDVRDRGRLRRVVAHVPVQKAGDVLQQHPRHWGTRRAQKAEHVRAEASLRAVAQTGTRDVDRGDILMGGRIDIIDNVSIDSGRECVYILRFFFFAVSEIARVFSASREFREDASVGTHRTREPRGEELRLGGKLGELGDVATQRPAGEVVLEHLFARAEVAREGRRRRQTRARSVPRAGKATTDGPDAPVCGAGRSPPGG